MMWVRANLRFATRLALLALAVQFAAAFGHVHAGNHRFSASLDKALSSTLTVVSVAAPAQPDGDGNPAQTSEQCDICAVVAMANSGVAATPPPLPAPPVAAVEPCIGRADFSGRACTRRAFQPRAPPIS